MRTFLLILLVVLLGALAGVGVWQMERSGPDGEAGERSNFAEALPEFLRNTDPDRLFCAESPETGVCRCITAGGERPDIHEEECRRRAQESR